MRIFGQELRFAVESRREIQRVESFDAEEDFVTEIAKTLRPGDVVWDVGANIGLISLVLAKSCAVTIHAFEPEPRNFAHLKQNILLNKLEDRVHAHSLALGECQGTIDLYVGGETGEGRHSVVKSGRDDARPVTVRMTTAIQAAEEFGGAPDVVKIDVEGAELNVIRGFFASATEEIAPREFFIEVHPEQLAAQGERVETLADMLTHAGYRSVSNNKRGAELHQHFARGSTNPGPRVVATNVAHQ